MGTADVVFKVACLLLLVVAVGIGYLIYDKPAPVVPASVNNYYSESPAQLSTGSSGGTGNPVSSGVMYFTDSPSSAKNSIAVVRYPSPAAVSIQNGLRTYEVVNGSWVALGKGIKVFVANSTPEFFATMNLDNFEDGGRELNATEYNWINVTGVPTLNLTSNSSIAGSEVPRFWIKVKVPESPFNFTNFTLFMGLNATNNSGPESERWGLMNYTTYAYNFSAGAFVRMNSTHANWSVANVTSLTASMPGLRGNFSGSAENQGMNNFVSPSNEIYIVVFPGGNTSSAFSNTTLHVNWISGIFYSKNITTNYSLNLSVLGSAASSAVNYTILGRDLNGVYVRENQVLTSNTGANARFGTFWSVNNYSEILWIAKNTSTNGNLSVRDFAGNTLVTLNDSILEAYPGIVLNGSEGYRYPANHSLFTDALDVSPYRTCTFFLNVSDMSATMTLTTYDISPDNGTWVNSGFFPGTMDNNARLMVTNDSSISYVRLKTTSTVADIQPANFTAMAVCKS